MLCIEIKVLV